jgi:carboxylate-amine ligase
MSEARGPYGIGVEEEFHVLDPHTRSLAPAGRAVLAAAEVRGVPVEAELQRSMLETGSPVCQTLDELRAELRRLRAATIGAAEQAGYAVAIAGTFPPASWLDTEIVPKERNERLLDDYGHVIREQLICGTHAHVGVEDPDAAVQLCTRIRPWLPILLALSCSSPYWAGTDTAYASYRSEIWRLWPVSGMPPPFANRAEHDDLVAALVRTGTIADERMTYWDVRPSPRYPTVEVRVADACTTVDEAVLSAALSRALVRTAHAQALRGEPVPDVPVELLTAAKWRAAREGLGGVLVDLDARSAVPARSLVERLLFHVKHDLEEHGEAEEVGELVAAVFADGTGADRQRRAFARRGRLEDVVDQLVAETGAG